MDIQSAARSLEKELQGTAWFTMVGVGKHQGRDAIFLYVKSPRAVPGKLSAEGWYGFPVVVKQMGHPRPIPSSSLT